MSGSKQKKVYKCYINGKWIDSKLFHDRRMEECPEYRLLRPVERRLFVKNLEIYGALVPPGAFGDTVDATGENPQKPGGGEEDPPLKGPGRNGAAGIPKSALSSAKVTQSAGAVPSSCLTSLPH